ncbi:hypothetical protein [Pedobacter sp.]|uniref:hypothetical protein n=1 Tax=Pedobacter sp. TaxID=1411316 RepID=UPI003D7FFEF0
MKRNIIAFLCLLGGLTFSSSSHAQNIELLADQNPRYAESVNKYSKLVDSLIQTQGTTVQQTYKAYDWYEAREERRSQRRAHHTYYDFSLGYQYGYGWSYPSYHYGRRNWYYGW